MASESITRQGSCLCKSVTYSLSGPPARHIQCNCLNCQKASGSAFLTNILYKFDQYKIETGADKIKIYVDTNTDSGGKLDRAFCSNCGSCLYIRNVTDPKMSGNIVVCAGTVDDNYKSFVPQSELFGHRRHSWVPAVKRKPKNTAAKI